MTAYKYKVEQVIPPAKYTSYIPFQSNMNTNTSYRGFGLSISHVTLNYYITCCLACQAHFSSIFAIL